MKKLIAITLVLTMVFALAACGSQCSAGSKNDGALSSPAIMWIILLIMFLCFIFPFVLVIINVFKSKADITSNPLALIGAHGFTLKNFPEAMKKMNFGRVFANSTIITVSATVLTILFSSMTAFVMVRKWLCAVQGRISSVFSVLPL